MPSSTDFVAKSVLLTEETRKIVNSIQPHMPPGTIVIGGYLNSKQQIFKLNYHWELLDHNIDRCLARQISKLQRVQLEALKKQLMSCAPSSTGYIKAHSVNALPDRSSDAVILRRWKIVRKAKREFGDLVKNSKLDQDNLVMAEQMRLIRSPILPPGHSHHLTGKALDIKGNKLEIERACWALGATLVFPEDSHVHAEFLKGVLPKPDYSRNGHHTGMGPTQHHRP
jgi:hypothetical protein